MKRTLLLAVLLGAFVCAEAAVYRVVSPNEKLSVTIVSEETVTWAVDYDGGSVMLPSAIDIKLRQGSRSYSLGRVTKASTRDVSQQFATPYYIRAQVADRYRQLTLKTSSGVDIEVRVYDDAAAYRLVYNGKQSVTVIDETAEFCFPGSSSAFVPYVNDNRGGERYCYSFESYYDEQPLSQMYADSLAITPLAILTPKGVRAVVMDAGVENYPGMFLKRTAAAGSGEEVCALKGEFAPYPLEQEVGGYSRLNIVPTKRADFIALLSAQQALPWRAVVVAGSDAALLASDISQRLAPACRLADTTWIRPGKVAWDWWNNLNLTGVDFKTGMNTDTYLYYIDFAAKNRLEYIIIDEGWSSPESLTEGMNPDIDLQRLIDHGRQKGVGIILWSSWRNMIGGPGNLPQPDKKKKAAAGSASHADTVMAHYAAMGIKGFKVDFFDRDDQQSIASAYELAAAAARHHLLLDLHGLKPMGIQRAYPNILNFEGVKGLENSKWEPRVGDGPLHNQPRYDVSAPYLRMLAGPMDYTPGAMTNAHRDNFFGNNDHPMSQGTRAHQVAMYGCFLAPLQMLADAPTKYEKEQETTDFIAQIPTTFDETIALDGRLGEYTLMARRKGQVWYVSALTDWTPRTLQLPLSFLSDGQHEALIFADGTNAAKEASDYRLTTQAVTPSATLTLTLAPGGGWSAIIR